MEAPDAESVSVLPAQKGELFETLDTEGAPFTVTTIEDWQPPLTEYVILAVPALTAVTNPELAPTEATPVFPLVHVPPETELERDAEAPVQ